MGFRRRPSPDPCGEEYLPNTDSMESEESRGPRTLNPNPLNPNPSGAHATEKASKEKKETNLNPIGFKMV